MHAHTHIYIYIYISVHTNSNKKRKRKTKLTFMLYIWCQLLEINVCINFKTPFLYLNILNKKCCNKNYIIYCAYKYITFFFAVLHIAIVSVISL